MASILGAQPTVDSDHVPIIRHIKFNETLHGGWDEWSVACICGGLYVATRGGWYIPSEKQAQQIFNDHIGGIYFVTNVRDRIESGDTDIVFARKNGGAWHVLQPEGKRAECSVSFDPRWSNVEDLETRTNPAGLGNCCNRRGCLEMFDYVDDLHGLSDPND